MRPPLVALGSRLLGVPEVLTLGVRPNFLDYSPRERALIHEARTILFPTRVYAELFTTLGKPIFPSLETYLYADDKPKQTTLFTMLGLPHPRTHVFYSARREEILRTFPFPFIAKLPRASARGRGVFRIATEGDLDAYLGRTRVAYIQECLPHERDIRVILIQYEPILAYWRIMPEGGYRTNLSQGGRIAFDAIPEEGMALARETARKCRFDDVGLDLLQSGGKWFVIEANMEYGRRALAARGMDLKGIFRERLLSGVLPGGLSGGAEPP